MSNEPKIQIDAESLIDVEAITRRVTEKLEEDISNTVVWRVRDKTAEKVLELIEPEIEKIIQAQKQIIIDGVTQSITQISEALAERIISSAIENLDGYRGKDIIKNLFN